MIKTILEKQVIFDSTLQFLSFLAQWEISEKTIPFLTEVLANVNLSLNNPNLSENLKDLAKTWKRAHASGWTGYFQIKEITDDTAYVEIHLHCPLRGTGKVDSCYKFMNYDRILMEKIGGSLTVLESQSNSGKNYCKLAIRQVGASTADLVPAHKK